MRERKKGEREIIDVFSSVELISCKCLKYLKNVNKL